MTKLSLHADSLEEVTMSMGIRSGHRSEGFHVTGLVRDGMAVSRPNKPHPTTYPEGLADMGWLWEGSVSMFLSKVAKQAGAEIVKPGEKVVDDIKGNPDFLIKTRRPVIIDAKCRFAEPHDPQERWDWMHQLRAYCSMWKTTFAMLAILFLPSRPPRAIFRLISVQFEQKEVDSTWQMLLNLKSAKQKSTTPL